MALNIPNVGSNMDTLFQGLNTGSDLIHKMMLNKYYSEPHASGDVANAAYVESLRSKYGEQDPRYIEAKRAHDLTLKGRESLMDYRGTLMDTAGVRATSPLGKLILEKRGKGAQDILDNRRTKGSGVMMPEHPEQQTLMDKVDHLNDKNPRTPEEQEIYDRKINKETTDEQARNVLRRAENLDLTRKAINVDDLTRYSGLKGTGKFVYDAAQATKGNPSEAFLANQKAVNAATLMADQMRQFYGDSIQPSAMDRLRHLSNPSAWYKDPKVAKAQFEQLNKILDTETDTYKKHGTSPLATRGLEYKDGKFVLGKESEDQVKTNEAASEADNELLAEAEANLSKVDPTYTAKNIRATAKKRGMTVKEVVSQLIDSAGMT